MFKSSVQEEAKKFLADTKTTILIDYFTHGKHFDDDKDTRDIYRITLKRHGRVYTFKFGQSVNGSEKGEVPTAYDVLSCLTKNDPGTFENFCSEFGYNTDSRRAEKTYKAVIKEWQNVDRLFSDVMERLSEIA